MNPSLPQQMKAVAIDHFGGPAELHTTTLPRPEPGPGQLLMRVDVAGIGVWDPYEREGGFDDGTTRFPHVLGTDGAGVVAAAGPGVGRFRIGDRVYACGIKGGFYAEYATVDQDNAAPIPAHLTVEEAGVLAIDGITALRGLEDTLAIQPGQTLLIFGASGGIGHLAVQLARRLGARVIAVASGTDGVELVSSLGAEVAIDGRKGGLEQELATLAPDGIDAALVLAGSPQLDAALKSMKPQGKVAFPHGVRPEPDAPEGVHVHAYDGTPRRDTLERLNALISAGPFHVAVGRFYRLDDAQRAHREIGKHHLGKLAMRIHEA